MMRLLVIGYGNPLRGDDGAGWEVARRLAMRNTDPEMEVLVRHQITPEMAEVISQAEKVVFVDAREGGPAGEIRREAVWAEKPAPGAFTHHVGPAALLAGARSLYGRAPEAELVSIGGKYWGYREGLSAPVERAVSQIVDEFARGLSVPRP